MLLIFQIAFDDMSQLLQVLCALLYGSTLVTQMLLQVFLQHIGHQAGSRAAHRSDLLQHVIALALVAQQPFECLDLTLHAPHARQQPGVVPPCMNHAPQASRQPAQYAPPRNLRASVLRNYTGV